MIQEMVDKFLSWKLPRDFSPDAGISFKPTKPDGFYMPGWWPMGTNLFHAEQAKQMFEFCAGETITALQAQLAERDKTILEQQESAYKDAKIIRKHLETIASYQRIAYQQRDGRLSALEKVAALESALKAERLAGKIEGLEEAAERIDKFGDRMNADGNALCDHYACKDELRRMADELKEGK